MRAFKTVMGIVGAVLVYFISIVFLPILKVKGLATEGYPVRKSGHVPDCRSEIMIIVGGEIVSGWMYKPDVGGCSVPCVILSHGLGATKDMILEPYALEFVKSGFAAITYDYRHYGESEGQPRQMFNALEQLQDLEGAIRYAQNDPMIDSKRIFLWGTSAGASHGIIEASRDCGIAGVIAQCGAYDRKEDSKAGIQREGYGFYLKLFMHAQRDKGRARFGLSRHRIPVYGRPGELAFIRGEKVYRGISELARESRYFKNEICAGFMLLPHAPDVIRVSKKVRCPVLIQVCEKDEIVSGRSHVKLVENLGEWAELITYPIGHFEIYKDEGFERAVTDQMNFLKKHL